MAASSVAGEELSIPGSHNTNWISLNIPSSSLPPSSSPPSDSVGTRDLAGCHVIHGDPQTYFVWRIHKNLPNVLEVFDVSPSNQFPSSGLRLVFKEALYPFSYIYKNEVQSGSYSLYAVTVSGCAYLCNIQKPSSYSLGAILSEKEILEINVRNNAQNGEINAVTATQGCLVIGRIDGSVSCYRLGKLNPNSPGFSYEIRDDAVIGRLWNLVSKARIVGAVQDLVISLVYERELLFAIHKDGILRVWDLFNRTRLLCFNFSTFEPQGINPSKLWVSLVDNEKETIHIAILHHGVSEQESDKLSVYCFDISADEKSFFSSEPSRYNVPLGEGKIIDVKINTSKLWILKQVGSIQYELMEFDCETGNSCFYTLQEEKVSKQLFQFSENDAFDDLLWTTDSLFSSFKDEAMNFISSIFLRRLIQTEVFQGSALRETFLDYNKFLSESQFQSLSLAGIRNEILSIIQREGGNKNPNLSAYYWKSFCSRFVQHRCENIVPYSLFLDLQNGSFGLIRKASISLFRILDPAEHLTHGSEELLNEILNCIENLTSHVGRAASALYQESLISPLISSDDIICQLVKLLEAGFTLSSPSSLISQFGSDAYFEKQKSAHKKQRKFSVDILLALNDLHSKANNWESVLSAIEKYAEQLSPQNFNFNSQQIEFKSGYNVNCSVLVQATSQIARKMFDSAFGVLLLLAYLVEISGQVVLTQGEIARIKRRIIPKVEEMLLQWLIIHFVGTTPTTRPPLDDYNSLLASLHIGNNGNTPLHKQLGTVRFTLACLLEFPILDQASVSCSFLNPTEIINLAKKFSSSILRKKDGEMTSSIFCGVTNYLVPVLLRHAQFEAAESVLSLLDSYSRNKKGRERKSDEREWCAQMHLRGFCLLMLANNELDPKLKEQKIHESIRCFFRAASSLAAPEALQNFSSETGFEHSEQIGSISAWRVHYYQYLISLFERFNFYSGACQFATSALEQVDGASDADLSVPASEVRGKLWNAVYTCSMCLKRYGDAYSAVTSNPDSVTKYALLKQFVGALSETGSTKILCDGEIPFIGLVDRVEKELFSKASSKPHLYKVLYAFEAQRNNWRKAASCMYSYSTRLRTELNHFLTKDSHYSSSRVSSLLQDILNALSCALNALHLVDSSCAWIDLSTQDNLDLGWVSEMHGSKYCVDIEGLEKEYILTSAERLLCLRNNKFKISGSKNLSNLVDVLIHESLYDTAFNVILKFWKGSAMKRELESAFVSIAQECCANRKGTARGNLKSSSFLLLSSADDKMDEEMDEISATQQFKGNGQWDTLQHYLEKYRKLHGRLPVTVAETLLHTDPYIELPLWLVHMFKDGRNAKSWGMAGQESDAATLFRLYINYGRYAKATNLLLEYLEHYASLRPAEVIERKKMSAVWFPYTAIHQLLCDLNELQNAGHDEDQCDQLKTLLSGALAGHLKQIEVDSEDALSSLYAEQEI